MIRFQRFAAIVMGLCLAASAAQAATYRISSDALRAQNCGVFAQCYVGEMSFDYDTDTGDFSNIAWKFGYVTSGPIYWFESTVTPDQDTKVVTAAGVPYTQVRVISLTGSFFTPDWLFYSDTPATSSPGTGFITEYSGASSYLNSLGLDIDIAAVIAGTSNTMAAVYYTPLGGYHAFGGNAQAVLVPQDPTPSIPVPGGLPLMAVGFGAFAVLHGRQGRT